MSFGPKGFTQWEWLGAVEKAGQGCRLGKINKAKESQWIGSRRRILKWEEDRVTKGDGVKGRKSRWFNKWTTFC